MSKNADTAPDLWSLAGNGTQERKAKTCIQALLHLPSSKHSPKARSVVNHFLDRSFHCYNCFDCCDSFTMAKVYISPISSKYFFGNRSNFNI